MSALNGRFVWYELMTTDTEAARAFYTEVVGWGTVDAQMPGMVYTMFRAGDTPTAGLMRLPAEAAGVPPNWTGYVSVEDVDATVAKVVAKGGAVHFPPTDIPGTGRFAIVADPQGAALAVFRSVDPSLDQPPQMRTPGRVGWHELYATDWKASSAWYADLFGWEKLDAMDMGPMGTYQVFGMGGEQLGGMMDKPAGVPTPYWGYYFNVGDIDAAAERVRRSGGQILMGPHEVPGGGWTLHCLDPQGAVFALLGSRP